VASGDGADRRAAAVSGGAAPDLRRAVLQPGVAELDRRRRLADLGRLSPRRRSGPRRRERRDRTRERPVALSLLAALSLPAVWDGLGGSPLGAALLAAPPVAALGLGLLAVADRWAAGWPPRGVARTVSAIAEGLRAIARRPRALVEIVALGALASMAGIAGAYALGRGLGLDLGPAAYFALVGGAILISALPLSIAGWGLREAAVVALFAAVGVAADTALPISVLFGVAMILVALPGGALWLAGRGRAPSGTGNRRAWAERRAP